MGPGMDGIFSGCWGVLLLLPISLGVQMES